ncbi:MAG: Eco57I restriction-modification methylase domain-containing protein [Actinobacteria bacterium]|nr:Eco57I restriction-modification methylase domain-containing protein [Actinomycetota bacterium]
MRPQRQESKGIVYTKRWVVDLILDFVGYRSDEDLATRRAVEPAAGEGAFLLPMVDRLLASLEKHDRPLTDAREALSAYELDLDALLYARDLVVDRLIGAGLKQREAARVASGWFVEGDYLLRAANDPLADYVVGNPPYIRYDDIPPELFARYRSGCPTMIGRCDIYVGFIEAGIKQLKAQGKLGFICADRWMRSAYGAQLRRYVADSASVDVVIEMHKAPAFDDEVSAYPAVIVLRRGEQERPLVGSADASAEGASDVTESITDALIEVAENRRDDIPGFTATRLDSWYGGATAWPWGAPHELSMLKWLEERFRPLEDSATGTRVGIGIATGADSVFVTKDPAVAEPERLLPLAMGADTRSGTLEWSGHYLVNPWTSQGLADLEEFPRLAHYLSRHDSILSRRKVFQSDEQPHYRTIDRVITGLLEREKLYFPDMKMEAHPVLDRGRTYPHHNLYFVTSDVWDLEVLGGILLSKVAELFVSCYCVKMRGGTLRFQAQYLRRIRVPNPTGVPDKVADALRQAFHERDRAAATAAAIEVYGLRELAEELL